MNAKIRETVGAVMQRNIPAVDATEKVSKIGQLAPDQRYHYVPVMLNGRLLGIVNSADIKHLQRMINHRNTAPGINDVNNAMRLYQFFQDEPVVVSSQDSLVEVARIFSQNNLSALPVVDNGKFMGIVTANDVLDHLINEN